MRLVLQRTAEQKEGSNWTKFMLKLYRKVSHVPYMVLYLMLKNEDCLILKYNLHFQNVPCPIDIGCLYIKEIEEVIL